MMRNASAVDICTELIGPAIRFHHGKVNSKLPGTATKVNFYQDFPFQPITKEDLITLLLFIDNVTLENARLEWCRARTKDRSIHISIMPHSQGLSQMTFWRSIRTVSSNVLVRLYQSA
ncbi:MAG: hypothetical protein P8M25_10100 [Paracoccaceae bacterium]|nr:hypothetical protein [Paracoccaceae bacterium]